jgi:hypothetical protein
MARIHSFKGGGGGQAYAKFLRFDLFWAADFHDDSLNA